MTKERFNLLMRDCTTGPGEAVLTQEEMDAGWHWCAEFDGLLVNWHDNEGEGRFCSDSCGSGITPEQLAVKRAQIAAMPPALDPEDEIRL